MKDDAELLNRYVHGDEAAFAELVRRRLPLVYQAALRQVRRPHLAEEITQVVFVILAQKAKRLGPNVVLSGWLYQTTRYACQKAIRTEVRRIKREREAMEAQAPSVNQETTWNQVEPVLDELMARLREPDRLVLVLRFLENRSLAQIGDLLGTSEDAAQKRVSRALDRLRALFAKRSIHASSGVLAALLAANASGAVPSSLAAGVATGAAAGAATWSPLTSNLVESTLQMMTWIKIKTLAPVGAAVAVAAGVPIVGLHQQKSALEAENEQLRAAAVSVDNGEAQHEELVALREAVAELESLRAQAAEVHKLRAKVAQLSQEGRALAAERDQWKVRAEQASFAVPNASAGLEENADAEEELGIQMLNHMKRLALGVIMYASSHENQMPSSLGDINPEHVGIETWEAIDLDDLIYFDYGSWEGIENPGEAVLIATKKPFGPDPKGQSAYAYAFVDGHSETGLVPVGDDGRLPE